MIILIISIVYLWYIITRCSF